jgi:uncharacterized membrane protein
VRLATLVVVVLAGCGTPATPKAPSAVPIDAGGETPAAAPVVSQAELDAAERVAFDRAKPVIDRYCSACHTKRGKKKTQKRLDAIDFSKYPPTGRYAKIVGGAVRDVLGQSGVPATMPFDRKGAVVGDELAAVMGWVDAWAHAHHER